MQARYDAEWRHIKALPVGERVAAIGAHTAKWNKTLNRRKTALITAAEVNDTEAVRYLLSQGIVDLNERDYNGDTALSMATMLGYAELARLLLAHGADPNASHNSPLTEACRLNMGQGDFELVRLFVEKGALVEFDVEEHGPRPLQVAHNIEIVKYLIAKGANPAKVSCGHNALMGAGAGSVEMMKLHLEHGADPNILYPPKDATVLDYVLMGDDKKSQEQAALLRQYGALTAAELKAKQAREAAK